MEKFEKCPECNGSGEIQDCEDIFECEVCNGSGEWEVGE